MKSLRTERCHVGLSREFVGTACCTYGQSNTTNVETNVFCRQMAPLGASELIEASPIIIKSQRFAHPNSLEQKCVIAVKHYQHARCIMYLLGHYRHIRDNMIVFCNLAHTCLGLGYLEPQQRRQPVDAYQYSLTKCHEWIWIWDWSNHF